MRWLLLALLACGGAPKAPPPSNVSVRPEPPPPPSTGRGTFTFENDGLTNDASTGEIVGTVHDHHKEPLIGTTVVATSPVAQGELVTIADESGRYELKGLRPGRYKITFYFTDTTFKSQEITVDGGHRLRVKLADWNTSPLLAPQVMDPVTD